MRTSPILQLSSSLESALLQPHVLFTRNKTILSLKYGLTRTARSLCGAERSHNLLEAYKGRQEERSHSPQAQTTWSQVHERVDESRDSCSLRIDEDVDATPQYTSYES